MERFLLCHDLRVITWIRLMVSQVTVCIVCLRHMCGSIKKNSLTVKKITMPLVAKSKKKKTSAVLALRSKSRLHHLS